MGRIIKLIAILSIICIGGIADPGESGKQNDFSSSAMRNMDGYNMDVITGKSEIIEFNNTSDDFNLPVLRNDWATISEKNNWSLRERPGFLRIKPQSCLNNELIHSGKAFAQHIKMNYAGEVACQFDLTNLLIDGSTGIFFSNKQLQYIGVKHTNKGFLINTCIDGKQNEGPIIENKTIMLRTIIDATKAWFEYSIDGITFTPMGESFKINSQISTNELAGIYCIGNDSSAGFVDVDWFYLKHKENSNVKFADVPVSNGINDI